MTTVALFDTDSKLLQQATRHPKSALGRLFAEGHAFDFFQAVRLLGLEQPGKTPPGYAGAPADELVRFQAHLSLAFPASAIYEMQPPAGRNSPPRMTVTFLGLTGPSGVLPVHYTELLLKQDRDARGDERHALRAWLDLFNHRLTALFYRAWEKYRLYPVYERQARGAGREPDPFTHTLFSLVGLGTAGLRDRLRVDHVPEGAPGRVLARVDDLALLYYGGLLAQRPRNALALQTLVQDYFGLPVKVLSFRGQWLRLDPANQSRLADGGANGMGTDLVVGERVWDVQSKVRLRLGPLRLAQFLEFIPDRAVPADGPGTPPRRFGTFFLLVHLVRLYLGPELDFDVQLVLERHDVPESRLAGDGEPGSRLGWNSWLCTECAAEDADDAVFEGEEVFDLTE